MQNHNTKTPSKKPTIKYKNCCALCDFPNTKRLITIKRGDGDIHLCRPHARMQGVI